MAVLYEFICDTCGASGGEGVTGGMYTHPEPPRGWLWKYGSPLQGPITCSEKCWTKFAHTVDGKIVMWESHESRVERLERRPVPAAPAPQPEPRMPHEPPRSWVYFAQAGDGGPIKIGTSRNPVSRVREMSTACPETLRIVGLQAGGRGEERRLHEHFSSARMHGEWFTATPDLCEYINRLPRGDA